MNDKYILDGQIPIPVGDLVEWAQWFEKADRHVAQDVIEGIRISTVFLGLDHSFGRTPYPILFETMVFGGKFDQECERYATWEQAVVGHNQWCDKVAQS
jgi:hypothetical protein